MYPEGSQSGNHHSHPHEQRRAYTMGKGDTHPEQLVGVQLVGVVDRKTGALQASTQVTGPVSGVPTLAWYGHN